MNIAGHHDLATVLLLAPPALLRQARACAAKYPRHAEWLRARAERIQREIDEYEASKTP